LTSLKKERPKGQVRSIAEIYHVTANDKRQTKVENFSKQEMTIGTLRKNNAYG